MSGPGAEPHGRGWPAWRLSALISFALFLIVGLAVCFPLTNSDIWWHLATGRWIVQQGRLPLTDPFSADVGGQPWTDVHWLFQLLSYGVYRLGGVAGLVLAKCLLVGAGAVLLLRAAAHAGAGTLQPLVAAGIALALYPARHLVLARPIVITLICLAATVYLLERFRRERRMSLLCWLLPLQLLWANCQALWVLGPLVVACYLLGEGLSRQLGQNRFVGFAAALTGRDLRRLSLALLGVTACGLVTPHGIDGPLLALRLFGRIDNLGSALFSRNVAENVPIWLLSRSDPARVAAFHWVAAACFGSFVLARDRFDVSRLALASAMFALALLAYRNALLFCWVAGPITAMNLAGWLERGGLVRSDARRLALTGLALAALTGLGVHRLVVVQEGSVRHVAPFRVPAEAVQTLARIAPDVEPTSLFNSVRHGGYVAWALYPRWKPSIDGRLVLRSAEQFAAHLRLLDRPDTFDRVARARGWKVALVPTAYPQRYLGLAVELNRDPRWDLLYADGAAALYVQRDVFDGQPEKAATVGIDLSSPAQVRRIAGDLARRHRDQPRVHTRALIYLARFLAAVDQTERAIELLRTRRNRAARSFLARLYYLAGDARRAELICAQLVAQSADDPDCLALRAQLAREKGQNEAALDALERALAVDPYHPLARQLLIELSE